MLRHFLYKSQSETLRLAGKGPDIQDGYLRAELSETWTGFLNQFEKDAGDVEGQARTASVPLVAVLVPGRSQAAMISSGSWSAGLNPYKLGDELRSIIVGHGEVYVDILADYRTLPNAEQMYFPVDGHLNANGNSVVALLLSKELSSGVVPELSVVSQAKVDNQQSR
jgi:hypothetical protein